MAVRLPASHVVVRPLHATPENTTDRTALLRGETLVILPHRIKPALLRIGCHNSCCCFWENAGGESAKSAGFAPHFPDQIDSQHTLLGQR